MDKGKSESGRNDKKVGGLNLVWGRGGRWRRRDERKNGEDNDDGNATDKNHFVGGLVERRQSERGGGRHGHARVGQSGGLLRRGSGSGFFGGRIGLCRRFGEVLPWWGSIRWFFGF